MTLYNLSDTGCRSCYWFVSYRSQVPLRTLYSSDSGEGGWETWREKNSLDSDKDMTGYLRRRIIQNVDTTPRFIPFGLTIMLLNIRLLLVGNYMWWIDYCLECEHHLYDHSKYPMNRDTPLRLYSSHHGRKMKEQTYEISQHMKHNRCPVASWEHLEALVESDLTY